MSDGTGGDGADVTTTESMGISRRRETSKLRGFGRQKPVFHTLHTAEIKRQLRSGSAFDLGREVVLKFQLARQASDWRLWL